MGKIKRRSASIKWSFFIYLPFCFIFAFAGSMIIGHGTNLIQEVYSKYEDAAPHADYYREYHFSIDESNNVNVDIAVPTRKQPLYFIISSAQFVFIPVWVIFCIGTAGAVFYHQELKKPIGILLDASKKISDNQLDFKLEYKNRNELGQLCGAFEEMRQALYENNRELWRSLEERKRLNSAFSHDLRTPLTVLKGYNEFLEKYIHSGQLSEEKVNDVLSKMRGQINRLENYTYKMSAVQKLEDISPDISQISLAHLEENFAESGKYICRDKKFSFELNGKADYIYADSELVSEVYENILSNAARYAKSEVKVNISVNSSELTITVEDDGAGFSKSALQLATHPFYRGDREQNGGHFGLGLYICKIICEKCGGSLNISNTVNGGCVTAKFFEK